MASRASGTTGASDEQPRHTKAQPQGARAARRSQPATRCLLGLRIDARHEDEPRAVRHALPCLHCGWTDERRCAKLRTNVEGLGIMNRRTWWTALLAACGVAKAQGASSWTIKRIVVRNGKPKPRNGECPVCGTMMPEQFKLPKNIAPYGRQHCCGWCRNVFFVLRADDELANQ